MANGKVQSIPTDAQIWTPVGEVEWNHFVTPNNFKKWSTDLILTEADAAKLNSQIVDALQPYVAKAAEHFKVSTDVVKVKKTYTQPHGKWNKEKKVEELTGRGFVFKPATDAFYKSGDAKPAPKNFAIVDGQPQDIVGEVANGSKGQVKFTVNACFEKVEVDEDTTIVKLFASIRPVSLKVTELKVFNRSSAVKVDPYA